MEKLFTLETFITFKEYLKMKQFWKKLLKRIILIDILLIIVSLFAFVKDLNILFLFSSMSILILYLSFIIGYLYTIFYYYCYNKEKNNLKCSLIFYKKYIERKRHKVNETIQYDEIIKIKEDANKFILLLKDYSIKILKSNCHKKDIAFIQKILHQKEDERKNNLELIQLEKKLDWLFIITLALFIIILTINLYLIEQVTNGIYKYIWSMMFALPFSIISIIVGIKYRDNIKSRKNIISGSIITFLVLIYSLLSLIPINNNYQEAFKLEHILGIGLPATGIYQKEEVNTSYYYITHELLFSKKEEYLTIEEEIKENKNWLRLEEMQADVAYYLPVVSSNNCYYSLYFEEANKYNDLPNKSGKYHIFAMLYDEVQHILRIDEYIYELNI